MMISDLFSIYFRSQVVRYLVFSVGRNGSNFLLSSLESHPNITALIEPLIDMSDEEKLPWTRDFLNHTLIGRNRAIGFSIKYIQIPDPEEFTRLLQDYSCKIIFLQRRNRIKSVVSYFNGLRLSEARGTWNLLKKEDRLPAFAIKKEDFENHLKKREAVEQDMRNYVESLPLPVLRLYYEDMLKDMGSVLHEAFSFLEVKPRPVQEGTFKNTSDDLSKVLTNFSELRTAYVGTAYEPMFDEVLVP